MDRRSVLKAAVAVGAAGLLARAGGASTPAPTLTRPIPSTGEPLPVVGLGSWITFNVGRDPAARGTCTEVMRNFFAAGGRLIDSSPMYGSAQEVIGHGLGELGGAPQLFSADKVWTGTGRRGPEQIEVSQQACGVDRFDLLQVHNLLALEAHMETLLTMKAAGMVRYVWITTSEGRRHPEFEQIMRSQPLDFVQFSYNILDREAEQRLLPLAHERGIAVLVNRPFRQGALTRALERQALPQWAGEIDCASWAQILLKFIVSHPQVTCVIPATRQVAHVLENMDAARGRMPDQAMRRRMSNFVEEL